MAINYFVFPLSCYNIVVVFWPSPLSDAGVKTLPAAGTLCTDAAVAAAAVVVGHVLMLLLLLHG